MSEMPQGTVTLLFTDVEGSTKLVHELGDRYAGVLADHRRLVRECVAAANGHEVDSRGDEFFLAFHDAASAVSAAVSLQQSLAAHEWPAGVDVRVRIGLHTGQPTVRDDGYFGMDVHRAARICQAGHGGQVLLSETTCDELDGGYQLQDLGEHELPGIPVPERIYQLNVPGLPTRFPELEFARARRGMRGVRVVLAEDSVLLREGIARLLEDQGFEVAAQSGTAEDLLRHVGMHKPDVAIVDIRMPPTQTDEGLRAAQEIRSRWPDTGVLVLSQYVEPGYAMELLGENAEGVGYLLKDRVSDVEEFCAAVRRVGEGGSALDPAVVSQLVGRRRRDDPLEDLTPRERQVLELMAGGRSNQAIADNLVITLRAVEKHVTSIFGKLRLPATDQDHRRVLAVLTFLKD
jgi:DNA-binding NarL/FixJ family response regulator/class 3 adenylate cyclase